MFKHILIPTDGSELSYKAVCAAMDFAREMGARVTAYHALPKRRTADDDLERAMAAHYESRARELGRICVETVGDAARDRGVACECVVDTPDSAYEGIVAAAKAHACDLIFLASHGRTGGPVEILGSVAQKVVALSPLPVLVYRTR